MPVKRPSKVAVPLQQHLLNLAAPKSRRLPGAVLACGSSALLDAEQNGQSWLVRLKCELRHPDAEPRAAYIGTSDSAEDDEYNTFVRAVLRLGIRTCLRIRADAEMIPTSALTFLEQSAVVWFGDAVRPEHVWRAMERAAVDLVERVRWRHKHGALLVGVSNGVTLLGAHGWQSIQPGESPPRKEWEGPERRVTFEALGAMTAVVGVASAEVEVDAEASPRKKGREELELVVAQLPLETIGYVIPRDAGLLSRHDGTYESIGREVRKLVCSSWHTQVESKSVGSVPVAESLEAEALAACASWLEERRRRTEGQQAVEITEVAEATGEEVGEAKDEVKEKEETKVTDEEAKRAAAAAAAAFCDEGATLFKSQEWAASLGKFENAIGVDKLCERAHLKCAAWARPLEGDCLVSASISACASAPALCICL